MTALCLIAGCDMVGVFPAEGGVVCFTHSSPVDEVTTPAPTVLDLEDDTAGSFHTDVVSGLAALLLEHTSMTTLDVEDATGAAMRSLAAATGWTEDVAAGVLLATTYVMAAGEVTPEALLHGAEVYESQATADELVDDDTVVDPSVVVDDVDQEVVAGVLDDDDQLARSLDASTDDQLVDDATIPEGDPTPGSTNNQQKDTTDE